MLPLDRALFFLTGVALSSEHSLSILLHLSVLHVTIQFGLCHCDFSTLLILKTNRSLPITAYEVP